MKAKIGDIQRLAKRVGSLSSLFSGTRRAAEAEVMVAQTFRASVVNHREHGEAFSFRGKEVFSVGHGGLVDNATAYGMLTGRGYFVEEGRDGRVAIFVTQKLVEYLDAYFARKDYRTIPQP